MGGVKTAHVYRQLNIQYIVATPRPKPINYNKENLNIVEF